MADAVEKGRAADNAGFVKEVPEYDEKGRQIGVKVFRGKGGLEGYLTWVALHHPVAFVGQLGRFIPMQG
jgi:hypothetical protein